MERAEIEARIRELARMQPWNHDYELPYGLRTRPGHQVSHGKNHVKLERLVPLFECIELKDKTVLDVGCNEGFFSFHMAEAGARVLGIDVDEKRLEKAKFVHSMLGTDKRVQFERMDIYSERFKALPRFDLCLCLGFIHRVPDPFRALSSLADRSDMIIFEWKALKFGPHDDAFAYFSHKGTNNEDYYGTEYWLLSYSAVERIMRRFGYTYFHRIDNPCQSRAIIVVGRNYHPIFDRSDEILHRGWTRVFLSHTKRYLQTLAGIVKGRVNA